MPDVASALVDTSVAVPLLVEASDHHNDVLAAIGEQAVGIAGHAAVETCSVLSRLPGDQRLDPATAWGMIRESFPARLWMTAHQQEATLARACAAGISGGALYDALVAGAARAAGLPLITRDARALPTYAALGIEVVLVETRSR